MATVDAITLERFLDALRASEPAFRFGVREIARAVQVLEILRAGGRIPEQPAELASYIAPTVCSSREEQELFRGRFSALLADHEVSGGPIDPAAAAARAAPGVDPTVPSEPTENDLTLVSRQQRLARLVWISAVALLLLGAAGLFLSLSALLNIGPFPTSWAPTLSGQDSTRLPQRLPTAEDVRVGLALLPWTILAALLAWRDVVNARLAKRYTLRRLDEHELRFGDPHDAHLPQIVTGRALQALRRPLPTSGVVFDVQASIAAAVAEGGRALPRVRTRERPPEFLLLVQQRGAADHMRRVARDLAAQMRRAEIAVAVYETPGAQERLRPRPDLSFKAVPLPPERDGTVGLAEALEAALDAVVLVFGEGEGLAIGESAPEGSAATLLAARKNRAVLSTRPLAAWGRRERVLEESGYAVIPADAAGLVALGEWLSDSSREEVGRVGVEILLRNRGREARALGPYPRLLAVAPARFSARTAPPSAQREQLLEQLSKHLGPEAMIWLCALSVYPAITPDLTRVLGRRLSLEHGHVLFTEQRYLALARLPWVGRGIMPDWLREVLIARLPTEFCGRVRKVLQEILIRPSAAGSVALQIVRRDDPVWRNIWRALARRGRREAQRGEPLHDQVFLSFMSNRRPLSVRAPRQLITFLRQRSPDRAVALAALASMALSLALLASPEWLLPALPSGAYRAFWLYGLPMLSIWNLLCVTRAGDQITSPEWLVAGCSVILAAIWPYVGLEGSLSEMIASAAGPALIWSHLSRWLLASDEVGTIRFLSTLAPPGPWLLTLRMLTVVAGGLAIAVGLTFGALSSIAVIVWPWFVSAPLPAETIVLSCAVILTTALVLVLHKPSLLRRHPAPVFGLAMAQVAALSLMLPIVYQVGRDTGGEAAMVYAAVPFVLGLLLRGVVTRFLGVRLHLRLYLLGVSVAGAMLPTSTLLKDGASWLILSGGAQALILALAVWTATPSSRGGHFVGAAVVPSATLAALVVVSRSEFASSLSSDLANAVLFGLLGPLMAFAAVAVLGRFGVVQRSNRDTRQSLVGFGAYIKRAEDVFIAALILFLSILPLIIIAVAIKIDSPGPILFRQRRIGLNNRHFFLIKFRTMSTESTDYAAHPQILVGDPRVTRVGAILRRTSLDEVPQIFNVLKGDMSIVGPRPHAPGMRAGGRRFEEVVANYAARHRVKPGITGLAQVRGWSGPTTTEEQIIRRVESDLEYIARWSIWLDLLILARTLSVILRARNAI